MNPADIVCDNIKLSEITKIGDKVYVSYLKYKTEDARKKIVLKTPKLSTPFGLSNFKNEDVKPDKQDNYSIQFIMNNTQFTTVMNNIQNRVLNCLKEHKKTAGFIDFEKLEFKPIVYNIEDYENLIRFKLAKDKKTIDRPLTKLMDTKKNKIDMNFENLCDVLTKNTEMKMLIHISHVWFSKTQAGITIKLVSGIVYPRETIDGFTFLDSDSEE